MNENLIKWYSVLFKSAQAIELFVQTNYYVNIYSLK